MSLEHLKYLECQYVVLRLMRETNRWLPHELEWDSQLGLGNEEIGRPSRLRLHWVFPDDVPGSSK